MGGYFAFERMITTTFVRVLYFLGFIAVTAGGVALTVWAGMQLNDATRAGMALRCVWRRPACYREYSVANFL